MKKEKIEVSVDQSSREQTKNRTCISKIATKTLICDIISAAERLVLKCDDLQYTYEAGIDHVIVKTAATVDCTL